MRHPSEDNLALLTGRESGRVERFVLGWHVRNCEVCQDKVADFVNLREQFAAIEMPDVNWNSLALEMRANIRVGLEAGACVGEPRIAKRWNPHLAVAFPSLLLLVGLSFLLTDTRLHPLRVAEAATPVLQPTRSGIEQRKGTDSFALTNRQDVLADRTVNAQGVMEARYINGETGSVTINNVYLQQ